MVPINHYIFGFVLLLSSFNSEAQVQSGLGTFYHTKFWGLRTYSGEKYHPYMYTAAHRSLPMGTLVEVKLVKTDKKVIVRINDRGPFIRGGVIDVSTCAAKDLGLVPFGKSRVELRVLTSDDITDSLSRSMATRDSLGKATHPQLVKKKKKKKKKSRPTKRKSKKR